MNRAVQRAVIVLLRGMLWISEGRTYFKDSKLRRSRPAGTLCTRPECNPVAVRGRTITTRILYPREYLMSVLTLAYGVSGDQISGPEWLTTERYYIAATVPLNTAKDQFKLMLQGLLFERFHLTVHRETRSFSRLTC